MKNKDINLQIQYMKPCGCKGCGKHPLYSFDVYSDFPRSEQSNRWVEVQFKNGRKEIFHNVLDLPLEKEDMVAVEGSPGLDIGRVSLVALSAEMRRQREAPYRHSNPKQIFRLATPTDLERYEAVKAIEHATMTQSRQLAAELGLDMKIGDVEYQGDGTKAIFYYVAEGRVDFRQLIRVLATTFHIRVEMKQIGARQETSRIGGIGPCGRKLCCASWMNRFHSVNTQAARIQELSLNPDKLTGQCGKLKCCNTFEVDTYVEAHKRLLDRGIQLYSEEGAYSFFKADLLAGQITYRLMTEHSSSLVTISTRRAKQVADLNRRGDKPEQLEEGSVRRSGKKASADILDDNALTRFDGKKKSQGKARQGANRKAPKNNVKAESAQRDEEKNPTKE